MKRLTVILAAFFVLAPIAVAGIVQARRLSTRPRPRRRTCARSCCRRTRRRRRTTRARRPSPGRRSARGRHVRLRARDQPLVHRLGRAVLLQQAEDARRRGRPPAAVDDRRAVCALGARALGFGERQGRPPRGAPRSASTSAGRDGDVPQQLPAPEGLVSWKPIEGATRYEVLFPDIPYSFQTTTNVADEREFFTFQQGNQALWSSVRWRVRAIRYPDKDVLKNRLPSVSYGPWSAAFTSVNPPLSLGNLAATDTVSDTWDKKGQPPQAHELTPGFAWSPSPSQIGQGGRIDPLPGLHLHRRPLRQSRLHRLGGREPGVRAARHRRPARPAEVAEGPGRLEHDAALPRRLGRRRNGARRHRQAGPGDGADRQGGRRRGRRRELSTDASVDLWDSGWPTGRYYWTVVPVVPSRPGKCSRPQLIFRWSTTMEQFRRTSARRGSA